MNTLKVMYDGWDLVYAQGSPAELHLLALLSNLSPQVQAVIALPSEPADQLPSGATAYLHPTPDSSRQRLVWEQTTLPRIARQSGAGLLHIHQPNAPFFTRQPVIAEALNTGKRTAGDESVDLFGHLSSALGMGGLSRLKLQLWPADLPLPGASHPLAMLPPLVHPGFKFGQRPDPIQRGTPESFILYHGSLDKLRCTQILEAWSWAANSIGASYPLLIAGASLKQLPQLQVLLDESGLGWSIRLLPPQNITALAALYNGCAASFHPLPENNWGDPLRHAIVCGVPVAACSDPLNSALTGPAAYLTPVGNARLLGAGLLSLIVEESLGEKLAAAARERAANWNSIDFGSRLWEVYQQVIHPTGV